MNLGRASTGAHIVSQSKLHSLLETLVGTIVGFVLAFAAQHILFILYNIPVSNTANAWIVSWMTLLSVVRSYILRRAFNYWTEWRLRR